MNLSSEHQKRVNEFLHRSNQVNIFAGQPKRTLTDDQRMLLAKLAFEECMEYLEGLGISLVHPNEGWHIQAKDVDFAVDASYNIVEVIDGACDIRYVVTQAFSFLSLPDEPFQAIVDYNNLMKFSAGASFNEYGKLIKPPDHSSPEIGRLLDGLCNDKVKLSSQISEQSNGE